MRAHQNHLTQPEAKVLEAITTALRREGRAPSIREISVAAKVKSLSHVEYLLRRLEEKEQIERIPGSRGIRLLETPGIPILGRIAAGEKLDLYDGGYEQLDLGAHVRAVDTDGEYALRVRGDSMIEDHIFDGDYLLVRRADTAPDGAIVVALHREATTEAGAATVKRLYREPARQRVRLQPANAALEPKFVSAAEWDREWRIQGIVTAVYRPCHL